MEKIHSIVLAAGLSTRMGSSHTNKVCLEILKKPVICRAIEALQSAAINTCTVVLGGSADKVLNALSGYTGHVSFAFQRNQRGPADAFICAVKSLPAAMDQQTLLLITVRYSYLTQKTSTLF